MYLAFTAENMRCSVNAEMRFPAQTPFLFSPRFNSQMRVIRGLGGFICAALWLRAFVAILPQRRKGAKTDE